jgi:hypothetical protein
MKALSFNVGFIKQTKLKHFCVFTVNREQNAFAIPMGTQTRRITCIEPTPGKRSRRRSTSAG